MITVKHWKVNKSRHFYVLFHRIAHSTEHPSRGCPHMVLIFTAESTESMQIKCLDQGHNKLMSGFEVPTSVARNGHSNRNDDDVIRSAFLGSW